MKKINNRHLRTYIIASLTYENKRTIFSGKRSFDVVWQNTTTTWISRGAETDQRYIEFLYEVRQQGPCGSRHGDKDPLKRPCTPPYHIHDDQMEVFSVINGEMGYIANGKWGQAKRGDTIIIPKRTAHTFWASGTQDLTVRVRVEPAYSGYMDDTFFENINGVMQDSPWETPYLSLANILAAHRVKLADYSDTTNRLLWSSVSRLSKLCGLKAYYPEYTTNMPLYVETK